MKMIKYTTAVVIAIMWALNGYGQGQIDDVMHATDTTITDNVFEYHDTIIPVLDLTYHEFSSDKISWHKQYALTDNYVRFSNDVKNSWWVLDLRDDPPLWLISSDSSAYLNPDKNVDTVLFDVPITSTSNIDAAYYFINSLSLTNIYNGDNNPIQDGYILVHRGDTARWEPAAAGVGQTNLAANVGTRGVGVYASKEDSTLNFNTLYSTNDLLGITLGSDSIINFNVDLSSIDVTAGVGLIGGGSLDNDITLDVSIPSLPSFSNTVDENNDWLMLYDNSLATHYKLHPYQLLASIGAYQAGDGLTLSSDTFSIATPDTISKTSTNSVGTGHSHYLDFASYDITDLGDIPTPTTGGTYLQYNGSTYQWSAVSGSATPVDLYLNNVLKESSISRLNLVANGMSLTYGGSGKVTMGFGVQTLSGTTPTWNVNNGIHAKITLTGNTTIALSNLVAGETGNLTVTNAATAYTIQFSGYTVKITPVLSSTSGVITMSGSSAIDCLSWWYDGTYVIINGTLGYE